MRRSILFMLPLLLVAADPLEGDKFLEKADEKFEQAMAKAREAYVKRAGEAFELRLKTYRTMLSNATRDGDSERSTALKERMAEIDEEREAFRTSLLGNKNFDSPPGDTVKFGGHEYALIQGPETWHRAQKRCEAMGGHLAILDSVPESEFVRTLVATPWAWIGGSDEDKEGEWKWVTGAAIPQSTVRGFRIDNRDGVQHCLAVDSAGNVDDHCGAIRAAYICEWDK
ncbi:MAG TPA: C-type lectin domain-containing protein [Planctomycetaceae bacterium]|nr:C-type lectin domain-containing protein [Planctomycetaceae bacterium]